MEKSYQTSARTLAHHIRDMRNARNMTLADLANTSGVSRASLSRIENAEVSPTAETLAKLSAALRVPISQLIAPMEDRFEAHIPHDAQASFRDVANGFLRRNLSPPSAQLRIELVECVLQPKAQIAYDTPSFPGHEHHFVLLEGALEITVDDTAHALSPGDCLRYRLNGRSAFCAGPTGARYILALA